MARRGVAKLANAPAYEVGFYGFESRLRNDARFSFGSLAQWLAHFLDMEGVVSSSLT